ncbi:MAG: hypothetical protein J6O73_15530 [Lachnospiraceae bacterium]|nr:hypothetical protein [Lachnospiraceae bacterium]
MVEINTPGGSVQYEIPIVRVADYSLDQLFENRLFLLLPFYFFNHENELDEFNVDEKGAEKFGELYVDIVTRIRNLDDWELSAHSKEVITEQLEKTTKTLVGERTRIIRKIDEIMSGKGQNLN